MQAFILEKKILHGNFSSPALRVFLMVRPLASEISGDLTKEIDIDNNLNNYSPKARWLSGNIRRGEVEVNILR